MKTLSQHLGDYIDHQKALNYSGWTTRHARYCVLTFVRWLVERYQHEDPGRLRAVQLRMWQKNLADRKTMKGAALKARSINKHIATTNGFLDYLAKDGVVSRPLAEVLQPVKEPVLLPGSVLTHEQARLLMEQASTDTPDGYRLRTMLEVLYTSGIRVAELLGLDLDDVDFKNATARVLGKGRKERMVPIGRTALQLLENYMKAIRPLALKDQQDKALFVDSTGKRFPYFTLRRLIHACAKKAKLEQCVTAHTFRRSCATEMLRGNANIYHVKELLGHESLETLKHYAKLTITDLKATHAKCHPRERDGR